MPSRLTTKEILANYKDKIILWRNKGFGKNVCASMLSEETGKICTNGVMQRVFINLGFYKDNVKKKKTKKVDIVPQNEETPETTIEQLIEDRKRAYQRKRSKFSKHKRTLVLASEPVGIMVMGDPHVDNDGCDWGKIFEHIEIASKTEGVLAACVGDMQDNWIGRLARCYANSSVTASDGWRLSEWLISSMQWVAIVGGNHDAWANGPGVDPMLWLTKKCGVMCYAPDEIRITLKWKNPDLEQLVWILRHDFKGRSWYHPTHGPHKESMLDGMCHLLTAGHIHQWGQLTTEHRHGRISHSVRVRGYKRNDAYAISKGFHEQIYGESVLVVIDPFITGPQRISIFWDIAAGCDYLTFIRDKYSL